MYIRTNLQGTCCDDLGLRALKVADDALLKALGYSLIELIVEMDTLCTQNEGRSRSIVVVASSRQKYFGYGESNPELPRSGQALERR